MNQGYVGFNRNAIYWKGDFCEENFTEGNYRLKDKTAVIFLQISVISYNP
jgi:hypothetical protein